MRDKIRQAYHDSRNIHDRILMHGNFFSRMYNRVFWGGTDDNEIARKILSYIPDDFSGTLPDVPVGTGVFTHEKRRALPDTKIICLDYSEDISMNGFHAFPDKDRAFEEIFRVLKPKRWFAPLFQTKAELADVLRYPS